ncbi:MAG TPA: hypothetical protein DCL70_03775 [Kocuria sp.]|nr:hypothetical protein [Kocuria sp.]
MTVTNPAALPAATILGYPRIGPDRELKRALEAHWKDPARHPASTVVDTLGALRERTTLRLRELGLGAEHAIPSEGFAVDHVLDTALVRVSPEAYNAVIGSYKTWYFALGEAGLVAAIIFHALNGLRIILVDFWKGGTQHHKTLLWIVLGLWVVLTLGFAIRHFSLALGGH